MVEQEDNVQEQLDDLQARVEMIEVAEAMAYDRCKYLELAVRLLGEHWVETAQVFDLADKLAAYCHGKKD